MKKMVLLNLILFFALTMAVVVNFQRAAYAQNQTQDQAQDQTKTPNLPEYTKEPWKDGGLHAPVYSVITQRLLHKDGQPFQGHFYKDNPDVNVARNLIMIFLNEDGTNYYAEWIEYSGDPEKATERMVRSYYFKDGKWVLDREVRQAR